MVLRRIGILSCGKILGIVYAVIGLIVGGIISLVALFGGFANAVSSEAAAPALVGLLLGAGAVVFAPIVYGVMGFIGGIIGAAAYNLGAKVAGGLELELTQK